MKKSLIALAILASTGFAMAHDSSASATGSNLVTSASVASVSAYGPGSATSSVGNVGYAATTVGVSGSASGNYSTGGNLTNWTTTDTRQGSVGVTGHTETYNRTDVITTQSGSASAFGAASGLASAVAAGSGNFHTVTNGPTGSVSGNSSATSATGAISVGNGSSTQSGGMVSGFDVGASASRVTTASGVFFTTFSNSDVKNAATHATVGAVSNNYTSVSTGSAIGSVINTGSAVGNASSSVAGLVSAAH